MSSIPLISIIVPCYNQASFLDESLNSVYNQTFKNWECIIVNDGSTDNTDKVAEGWLQKDERFKYVEKTNGGLSSARNEGINKSKAKYILPFDADDKLESTYLNKAVKVLENDDEIEVLTCKVQFFGTKNEIYQLPNYTLETLLLKNCFIACSFFKRTSYIKVGGYDENLKSFEDWDFWISILKSGGKDYVIDEVLYFYRKHEANSLSNRFYTDSDFYFSLYDYIFEKHKLLYKKYFPSPIIVFNENKDLKAFNTKVKRLFFFKCYEKLKKMIS